MAAILNFTTVIIFASFLVFMFVMKSLFFEPMLRIHEAREKKMADEQAQAQALRLQLEALNLEYEQALKAARQKGVEVISQLRQQASKTASEAVGKARAESNAEVERQLQELAKWQEETYQQMAGQREALKQVVIAKVTQNKIPATSGH